MLRFELLNRLDSTREDLYKNSHLLNEGVLLVGELLSVLSNDTNPLIKENFHLFKKSFYATTDSGIQSNSSTLSTLSMPNLTLPVQTSALISNSNSAPNLHQEESDIDPIDTVRSLTAVHARLSNIKEEEEEYLHNTLKYIDDDDEEEEEEVEAQHMSVQTTEDDNQRFFSKL
ncbi:unnamed protein product [Adineta steineri]|uniref:Uncharacterized protein n=1 Tax=Adineta steineri TaxID=433720 RepID=A0A820IMG6_9BILA|nr:unnamed protein product [Adineta steineri]